MRLDEPELTSLFTGGTLDVTSRTLGVSADTQLDAHGMNRVGKRMRRMTIHPRTAVSRLSTINRGSYEQAQK